MFRMKLGKLLSSKCTSVSADFVNFIFLFSTCEIFAFSTLTQSIGCVVI